MHFSEYESGYEREYDGVYDENFVFYDNEEDEELYDEYEEDESEDLIMEEIPFVYCPSQGELAEA